MYVKKSEAKAGANNPMFGRKHSAMSKNRISDSMKRYWANRKEL